MRKKTFSRFLQGAVSMVMVASMLTGCGGSAASTSSSNASAETATTAADNVEYKDTLVVGECACPQHLQGSAASLYKGPAEEHSQVERGCRNFVQHQGHGSQSQRIPQGLPFLPALPLRRQTLPRQAAAPDGDA